MVYSFTLMKVTVNNIETGGTPCLDAPRGFCVPRAKQRNNQSGFTLVEVMIVVAIVGLLAAIAIPNFVDARETAQTTTCIANLKAMQAAKQQWATDNRKSEDDVPKNADLFGAVLYMKALPVCPAGGKYKLKAISKNPTCSINDHQLSETSPGN